MKKIKRFLRDIFDPKDIHGLDILELMGSLNDPVVRKEWMFQMLEELKRMNLDIDRRLLTGTAHDVTDLAARRKAYQDVLESILTAKRLIRNNNPKSSTGFDLDSVTVTDVA